MTRALRLLSVVLLSLFFNAAGVNHFLSPAIYLKMMPSYLPWPLTLVYVSGCFEVIGGIGLAVARLRRAAGWGLIALLIAVLPANIHMLLHDEDFPAIPFWALVLRLPLQAVLIAWVWWSAVASCSTLSESKQDELTT